MRRFFRPGIALFLAASAASTPVVDAREPKPDPATITRLIDEAIQKRLDAEKVSPSPSSSDAEFVRLASLDIAGVTPSADRAAAYLASKKPDKRAKLIDDLLASP